MKNLKVTVVAGLVFLSCLFLWSSWRERAFISKLLAELDGGKIHVDMVHVMDGDWELMCFSHPYDGPLYLKKYDKTYAPVAAAQDGAWGLLFINPDGSFNAVSGSRRDGFEFDPNMVCVERTAAKFEFVPTKKRWVRVDEGRG